MLQLSFLQSRPFIAYQGQFTPANLPPINNRSGYIKNSGGALTNPIIAQNQNEIISVILSFNNILSSYTGGVTFSSTAPPLKRIGLRISGVGVYLFRNLTVNDSFSYGFTIPSNFGIGVGVGTTLDMILVN